MTRTELYGFIAAHKLGVLGYLSEQGTPRSALVAETILYSCLPEANIKGPLHTVTFPRRETVTDPFEFEIVSFP